MYVCIHIYICMYVYIYICMYMYMHVYACICMYMYVCMYVDMYVCTYVCIYVHIYLSLSLSLSLYLCIHTYKLTNMIPSNVFRQGSDPRAAFTSAPVAALLRGVSPSATTTSLPKRSKVPSYGCICMRVQEYVCVYIYICMTCLDYAVFLGPLVLSLISTCSSLAWIARRTLRPLTGDGLRAYKG